MKGPDRFAKSYVLFLVGLLLFALQGRLPAVLSVTVANVLVVLGAAFVLEGTKLIFGLQPNRRLTGQVGLIATAAFAFFTFVRFDRDMRTILSSAFLAALLGAAGWTSWQRRARNDAQVLEKVTAVALTTCALLFWARAVAIGSGLVGGDLLQASPWMGVPPLLCTFCAVVWTTALLATTSRRLTTVIRSQNELLESLLGIARAAGDGANLDTTLQRTLETTSDLTGATGASLLMLDEEGRFLRGFFTQGDRTTAVSEGEAVRILHEGLAAWVVRERSVALVRDVEDDPRWLSLPAQRMLVRSALSSPIATGATLGGVLTLVHSQPGHFGEEQRLLLESTTAQIALALRHARMSDTRLRATLNQRLLNQVLDVSARQTDAAEIVLLAAVAIERGSRWPRVYLAIPGEDGHFRLSGRTYGLTSTRPRIDGGILSRTLDTGVAQTDENHPDADAPLDRPGAPWTRLAIPLRYLGRTLGVACIEDHGPFDVDDVALAEALAEAVSLGLGKAAAARGREELTRMMVHDLRGPIGGVIGALELLSEAPCLDETSRKTLAAAEKNARRQVNLVDGILEIARLEEGALTVRREDVSLSALVHEVLERTLPAAEARGLTLTADVSDDLPAVHVDPGLVARVFENLLGNAMKFSEREAGPIHVSARRDGTVIELFVHDSGPGVEEELRPRVFEKFAVGRLPGRGSGLGLSFCRLAVEAHGGRIWLEHPGPGAVFAFSLPMSTPRPA